MSQWKHWIKPDHVGFLLLLPFGIGAAINPTTFAVPFIICWVLTLIYDLMEHNSE